MMEVTIHWTSMMGDGDQRYLVDVPSVSTNDLNTVRPNPFDHIQANIAIDAALKAFRAIPPIIERRIGDSNRTWDRTITRIELRQTEDVVIPGVG